MSFGPLYHILKNGNRREGTVKNDLTFFTVPSFRHPFMIFYHESMLF